MALLDFIKRPLDAISSTAEERMKHPFIGSFTISWLLFNWKPILFLFVGAMKIEDKISFIEIHYSDIKYLLLFPLVSAASYVIALPYLSWGLDWILRKSFFNRVEISTDNQVVKIQAKRRLLIENLKTEKAEADYKNLKETNELISGLEKRIIDLQDQSKKEKEAY